MTDLAIRVKGLSKRYRIGLKQQVQDTLAGTLIQYIKGPIQNLRKLRRLSAFSKNGQEDEDILWALKDVSFEICRGEVVGIIGRNGAGKSTLLKILSRITEPTTGSGEIFGKVAALLEVGTGFHGELTGRENVYLNGTILGMTRKEITRKFDEIVDFSGVERFIDTPVKRYSTGMKVRLAFSVAAHLEPEILIIDEVLSVGDARFQRKCMGKMENLAGQGRTVVFVSHNMPAIMRLCQRTILLDNGGIVEDGPTHEVVSRYLQSGLGITSVREWLDPRSAPGNEIVRLCGVRVRGEDGRLTNSADIRSPVGIEVEWEVLKPGHILTPELSFTNEEDTTVFMTFDLDPAWRRRPRPMGRFVSTAWIPGNFLAEGTLFVGAGIVTQSPFIVHCDKPRVVAFQVVDRLEDDSARGDYEGAMPGVARPLLKWVTKNFEGKALRKGLGS